MKRLAVALAIAVLVGAAPAAAASPSASQITQPGDPSYVLWVDNSPSQVAFVARGTTSGSGNVDLNCYDGSGGVASIATNEPPNVLSTGIPVRANQLGSAPCVLRAVPTGDSSAHPPGSLDHFQGPRIVETSATKTLAGGQVEDYAVQAFGLGGFLRFQSAGSCSIQSSRAVDPSTLSESANLLACDSALARLASRSAVRIDGVDAYSARDSNPATPGWQPLSVDISQDPSTGAVTIDERDPYVFCAQSTYPPTGSSCSTLHGAGVALHRVWTVDAQDRVARELDAWGATDGRQHSLDAEYDEQVSSVSSGSPPFAAFDFPGSPGFADYPSGAAIPLARGTASVLLKQDADTPEGGDGQHPQGALTWASAPDGAATFTASDQDGHTPDFPLPYRRTIPASGATTLRFDFAQAFSLADVRAFAQAAEAGFRPSIAITSPADGTTTSWASALVMGTASDSLGVASVTVDGDPIAVASDGSWSAPFQLATGLNPITATVTNVDGTSVSRQIGVTLVRPAFLQAAAAPRVTRRGVAVRLRCSGNYGSCKGAVSLVTRELVRGRKVVSVAGRRLRRRTVVVGSKRFSIPAGRTVTITVPLNALGRRLLARFHRLPVRVQIKFMGPEGKMHTIRSGTLTIRPPRPRHRRR